MYLGFNLFGIYHTKHTTDAECDIISFGIGKNFFFIL